MALASAPGELHIRATTGQRHEEYTAVSEREVRSLVNHLQVVVDDLWPRDDEGKRPAKVLRFQHSPCRKQLRLELVAPHGDDSDRQRADRCEPVCQRSVGHSAGNLIAAPNCYGLVNPPRDVLLDVIVGFGAGRVRWIVGFGDATQALRTHVYIC